jgi:TatA/E family protein of Tat protein translocase
MPGMGEWIIIAFVGLLIFGRRLPEVGRSLGRSIVEFKKGVREAKDDIDTNTRVDDVEPRVLPRRTQPPPERSDRPRQEAAPADEDAYSEQR